jgi:hypothetical protein
MFKNTTSQFLLFTLIDATDGSAITSGTVTGRRVIDGGTQNTVTGTISHRGSGQWQLACSQADTNGWSIGFLFTHVDAIPVHIMIYTRDPLGVYVQPGGITPSSFSSGAINANAIGGSAITAAKIGAGAITADKIASNAITFEKIAASAIGSDQIATGALTFQKFAASAIGANTIASNTFSSAKFDDGFLTSTKFANGFLTGDKLAASAGIFIANHVWQTVIENTYTAAQLMRGFTAALFGRTTNANTSTPKFRDLANTRNTIDATMDGNGNRTNVTLDLG